MNNNENNNSSEDVHALEELSQAVYEYKMALGEIQQEITIARKKYEILMIE